MKDTFFNKLLELLAWVDKGESKQAQDVLRLIETYGDSGNEDWLHADRIELLEAEVFDFPKARARLLAQDALALAVPSVVENVRSLLQNSMRMTTFQSQMSGSKIRLAGSTVDQSGLRFGAFADTFLND